MGKSILPESAPILHYDLMLRSRYSETDAMGVVYHSRFLEYFEMARTEFVRDAGYPYADMERQGIMLPVNHVEIQYFRPVYYDQQIRVRLMIHDIPSARLITFYDVRPPEAGEPSVLGKVELVFVNKQTRRPVRAPELFLKIMHHYAELA